MYMKNAQENKTSKNKRELMITLFMIFLISSISAGMVIWFRIKMRPYQIKPEAIENGKTTVPEADKNAPQNEIK